MKNQHVQTMSQFPVHIRVYKQPIPKNKNIIQSDGGAAKKRTKVKILPLQL